jgi:hypothetical protein
MKLTLNGLMMQNQIHPNVACASQSGSWRALRACQKMGTQTWSTPKLRPPLARGLSYVPHA